MDFKAIEEMIKVMDNSSLGYLEVDWDKISIIMKKKGESGVIKASDIAHTFQNTRSIEPKLEENLQKSEVNSVENPSYKNESVKDEGVKKEDTKDEKEIEDDENIKEIVSPIVGTFYSKAGPDKADYVSVGDKVKKGDVLCIIEAMKIMNEISSDVDGEVVEVLAENGQMVEYGQCLFKIKVNK
jgi:acetyl-CoA carboxylase biotin carboxyl carrier protein